MKKLKLTANTFNKVDLLTRTQLKKVMGGYEGGGYTTKTGACKTRK